MKSTKLDRIVIIISALCIVGIGVTGWIANATQIPARVAYLSPAFGGVQNVWITDIDNLDHQRQLTFSEYGIFDFDVSTDGRWLAFADKNETSATRIRLLDIQLEQTIELVDCIALDAYCTTPVFSPDGTQLAYQRSELIEGQYEESRIWLIDMTDPNYETQPLFTDPKVVGHSPVWSQDNNTLAFYGTDGQTYEDVLIDAPVENDEHEDDEHDEAEGDEDGHTDELDHNHDHQLPVAQDLGIIVYDFVPRGDDDIQLRLIPSSHGSMGTISPNGQQVIFPEVVNRSGQFYSHLRLADLLNKEFSAFTDPDGATDDVVAQWSPNGQTVALARRYMDERWTKGHQLYIRDAEDDTLTSIAFDEHYNTSYFRWNSTGSQLVLQRFPLETTDATIVNDARPEIWVIDLKTNVLTKIAENAFLPQWASP